MGYLAAGLVFTSLGVNSLIYQGQSAKQAGSAGFILLSMVIVRITIQYMLRVGSLEFLCLRYDRLSGSSISDQRPRLRIANISTLSPCTKSDKAPTATAGLCPTRMETGQIRRTRHRKCILPLN